MRTFIDYDTGNIIYCIREVIRRHIKMYESHFNMYEIRGLTAVEFLRVCV
jgi:hypothetical protein